MSIDRGDRSRRAAPIPAVPIAARRHAAHEFGHAEMPFAAPSSPTTSAEMETKRLRIRMEALEHLLVLLLANINSQELDPVLELVNDISFSQQAGADAEVARVVEHMIRLVERSDRLRVP